MQPTSVRYYVRKIIDSEDNQVLVPTYYVQLLRGSFMYPELWKTFFQIPKMKGERAKGKSERRTKNEFNKKFHHVSHETDLKL